jgi:hypothetical protein
MPASFESKVVVVTGGSSGIGRAAAERVAAEGAADEIAAFVAFLLSDEAAFISRSVGEEIATRTQTRRPRAATSPQEITRRRSPGPSCSPQQGCSAG